MESGASLDAIEGALFQLAQNGTPGSLPVRMFDVGTGPFLSYFEQEVLAEFVHEGGATCRFFEGSYGFGKTHLLRLIREIAIEHNMIVVQTELTADLRLESWDQITRHVLQHLELHTEDGVQRGLARILHWLGRSGVADLETFRHETLPHPGFKKAIDYALIQSTLSDELIRFLGGERITTTALRVAGFPGVRDPLSQRNAESVIQTVTRALFALGIPGTVLLFDETDQSFRSSTARAMEKTRTGANLMRRFIDACATGRLIGTLAAFAVLPGFIEQCGKVYPALGQRLDRERRLDRAEPWRLPVIEVESVSELQRPADFVNAIARRFCELIERCGTLPGDLEAALKRAGMEIVDSQAGGEYRRYVVRRLAAQAVERLELA